MPARGAGRSFDPRPIRRTAARRAPAGATPYARAVASRFRPGRGGSAAGRPARSRIRPRRGGIVPANGGWGTARERPGGVVDGDPILTVVAVLGGLAWLALSLALRTTARGAPVPVPPLRVAFIPTPDRIDRLYAVARRTQGTVVTEASRLGGHVRFEAGFERRRRAYLFYEARPEGELRSVVSLRLPGRVLPRLALVSRGPGTRSYPQSGPDDWDFTVRGETAAFAPSEEVLERLHLLRECLRGDPKLEVLRRSVRLSVRGLIAHEEAGGTLLSRALSLLEDLDDELQTFEDARAIRVVAVSEPQEHADGPAGSAAESVEAVALVASGPNVCQICGDTMEGDTILCPDCRTPHHRECWAWFGGCSTFGCGVRETRR